MRLNFLNKQTLSLLTVALALTALTYWWFSFTSFEGRNSLMIFRSYKLARLADAAARGDVQKIDSLVKSGVNPNTYGKKQITPLSWALLHRNLNGFNKLLNKGADPNQIMLDAGSIVTGCAGISDSRYLESALFHGGNPNFPDKFGESPMENAIDHGFYENVTLLISHGGDPNFINQKYSRPLLQTVLLSENYDFARKLIELGANPLLPDGYGNTAANYSQLVDYTVSKESLAKRAEFKLWLQAKGFKFPVVRPEEIQRAMYGKTIEEFARSKELEDPLRYYHENYNKFLEKLKENNYNLNKVLNSE